MGLPLTFAAYRHEGILRRFKVTPVSPLLQTLFAWTSGLGVYLIARLLLQGAVVGSDPSQQLYQIPALSVLAGVSYLIALRFFRWE